MEVEVVIVDVKDDVENLAEVILVEESIETSVEGVGGLEVVVLRVDIVVSSVVDIVEAAGVRADAETVAKEVV